LLGVFDFVRGGFFAFFGGGDPDDLNAKVTANHLPPVEAVDHIVDSFQVVDQQKADDFPNVFLITLEGVTSRAISAYGRRQLSDGRIATPNIDAVASDGAIFTNTRAAYPSTWDAWLMISSGRYMKITEMNAIVSFGERYSRHNNITKVLKAVGINRWAHSHAMAYSEIIVGPERHELNWEDDFDAAVSDEDFEQGIYRGDNNFLRYQRFVDSLELTDRFFISEHMSDTHFPWFRTSLERAKELGFEDGLEWAEEDALSDNDDHMAYYQEISRMDALVGRMIDELKAKDLYDNTMIVIISDHGCQWYDHDHMYYPGHLYDQAMHVPMIIKLPKGVQKGGVVVDAPTIQMDIFKTIMELAGVKHQESEDTPFPGCNLLPLMYENATEAQRLACSERNMLMQTHYDMFAFVEKFKTKLIVERPTGAMWLFDLENDPRELHNLVDSNPELLESMLEGFRKEVSVRPGFYHGVKR